MQTGIAGWPNFVGVVDASSHGVGGITFGELPECPPTVFCIQWSPGITPNIVLVANPKGTITYSDLELTRLIIL